MRFRLVGLLLFFAIALSLFWWGDLAYSQEPRPDVPLDRVAGLYPITCIAPSDLDLAEICFVRADLPDQVLELGCVPALADQAATLEVTIERTPHIDAEVRCYATDTSANLSDYSENAGTVDFTPPGRPRVK